jgi:hypothetical protein
MVRQAGPAFRDDSFQRSGLLFLQAADCLESFPDRREAMLHQLTKLLESPESARDSDRA